MAKNNLLTYIFISYKIEKRLTSFDITDDDIILIINNLKANKAYGWDEF